MVLTDGKCPECDGMVSSDCIISGFHALGCEYEFTEEEREELWRQW